MIAQTDRQMLAGRTDTYNLHMYNMANASVFWAVAEATRLVWPYIWFLSCNMNCVSFIISSTWGTQRLRLRSTRQYSWGRRLSLLSSHISSIQPCLVFCSKDCSFYDNFQAVFFLWFTFGRFFRCCQECFLRKKWRCCLEIWIDLVFFLKVFFFTCVFFSVGQIDGHKLDADLCRVIGIPNNLHVSTVFEEIQTTFGIF